MDIEPTNQPPNPPLSSDGELPPDTEPVFLDPNDGEEIHVDDQPPPPEDEDDGSPEATMSDTAGAAAAPAEGEEEEEEEGEAGDPAIEISCHHGPVYTLAVSVTSPSAVSIASGGGDDKGKLRGVQVEASLYFRYICSSLTTPLLLIVSLLCFSPLQPLRQP